MLVVDPVIVKRNYFERFPIRSCCYLKIQKNLNFSI